MSKTAKQILDAVNERLGLPTRDQYYGFNDPENTLPAIANEVLEELTQEDFPSLRVQATISMTTATSYTLPADRS